MHAPSPERRREPSHCNHCWSGPALCEQEPGGPRPGQGHLAPPVLEKNPVAAAVAGDHCLPEEAVEGRGEGGAGPKEAAEQAEEGERRRSSPTLDGERG